MTTGENRMKLSAAWILVISASLAIAQTQESGDILFRRDVKALAGPDSGDVLLYRQDAGPGPFTVDFIGAEMSFGDQKVKGAQSAADAVTEPPKTLSDGNHITRKSSATIYRDSEGRTRREETLAAIGPWAAAGDPPQHVFINDPASGT